MSEDPSVEQSNPDEKSIFERIGGSQNDNIPLVERVGSYLPWLVVVGKKDKQKTYSWHKKNLKIMVGIFIALILLAAVWDQSSANGQYSNSETNKFTNPNDIQIQQNALPSVNPAEVKSNLMPAQLLP